MLSKDRFSIDDIMFDPAEKLIKDFRKWYKSHNDPKFSKPLIELLLNNSKMENWPSEFTTKELLFKNKEAFLNIKCKEFIMIFLMTNFIKFFHSKGVSNIKFLSKSN